MSKEICSLWNWHNGSGRLKDMACRTLLLKLEKLRHIRLPAPCHDGHNGHRNKSIQCVIHSTSPIQTSLKNLEPIEINVINNGERHGLFKTLLSQYHYLSYTGAVGENVKYIIFDRDNNPLGCVLFGAAAWKVKPRDDFIGWDINTRKKNLGFIVNNMRFLILPWVRVPHLASRILGGVARRISGDWEKKYGHPVHLLETFVECERFKGTCYKAANWICVGQTKGRTRNDQYQKIRVPVKDIYLYPLVKQVKEALKK
ncbi:DUF4338 domain-containing protein [Patescibacteria group bacterium]|nr:DUF4338 domain-containing protein [Patescibacteria group bacterium]MBU1970154.1 DUF4338 domain-containing protein [Patescibacteria group bacterium]